MHILYLSVIMTRKEFNPRFEVFKIIIITVFWKQYVHGILKNVFPESGRVRLKVFNLSPDN